MAQWLCITFRHCISCEFDTWLQWLHFRACVILKTCMCIDLCGQTKETTSCQNQYGAVHCNLLCIPDVIAGIPHYWGLCFLSLSIKCLCINLPKWCLKKVVSPQMRNNYWIGLCKLCLTMWEMLQFLSFSACPVCLFLVSDFLALQVVRFSPMLPAAYFFT